MKTFVTPQNLLPNDGGRQNPQRLVVLLPNRDVDEVKLAWAIRQQASPAKLDVLLVTIAHNVEDELAARRRLATIASLVNEYQYDVEFLLAWDRSWIHTASQITRPGDLFACPPDVTLTTGFRKHEPLHSVIANRLHVPVQPINCIFSEPPRSSRLLMRMLYWIVIVAILVGFFFLESDATQAASGWIGQTMVALLMVCELGVLYFWSSFTG